MSKPDYERIYLVPEDGIWCWAGTPAPGAGQSNADAVEYVRADLYHTLAAQVESLLDDRKEFVKKEFQLLKEIERLEIELKKRDEQNAALAAQVLKLEKRIKAINEGVEEYKSMSNDATAGLVHKALMSVREEIIQRDLYQTAPDFIEQFANQYADSIRQGEVK